MQRLMFGHAQPHRRHLLDLAALAPHHRRVLRQQRVTSGADQRAVLLDCVRRRHQMQRRAPVPELPTRLLAAALAQALRFACQAVTRGRLAASVAILGQPTF